MTKLKTRKALLKRIKITGRKKILTRRAHQGHFNAKESGNQTRNKRRDNEMASADSKQVRKILPNI